MKGIFLTKEQADKVKGRHGKYSELEPIEINKDFILPADVMDDPEHREVINDLGDCKFAEIEVTVTEESKTKELKEILTVKSVSEVKISIEKP